jgi:hypothetical protein
VVQGILRQRAIQAGEKRPQPRRIGTAYSVWSRFDFSSAALRRASPTQSCVSLVSRFGNPFKAKTTTRKVLRLSGAWQSD